MRARTTQATARALSYPGSYNDIAALWNPTWADILAQKGPVKALLDDFTSNELSTVRGWLGGKATTIFGGSFEIQNNIISKRILGLPDPLGPSGA